jgi:hypothetical protein
MRLNLLKNGIQCNLLSYAFDEHNVAEGNHHDN